MKTFSHDGVVFDAVSPTGGTVAGNAYLIGAAIFGVAVTDSAAGDTVSLRRLGVYSAMPKAAGAAVFTKTSASNTRVGVAASAQASADTTGDVLLSGQVG